jgi:hypothetical protein
VLIPHSLVVHDDVPVVFDAGVAVVVAAVVIGDVELIHADCGLSTVVVNVEPAVEAAGKCGVTVATFMQRLDAKFIAPGDVISFRWSNLVMKGTHQ